MARLKSILASLLLMQPTVAQVNVLTYQYDSSRAGANSNEIVLGKSNVNPSAFGKLFSYPVDGYVYGQPLYLGNLTIAGKGTHNVVFVATEHDSVYAFDADSNSGTSSAPLWSVSFLSAAAGVTSVPYGDTGCGQIEPEIGITGTPVIDPGSGTIYLVAMTKEVSGSSVSYVQRLHALDVSSGAEKPGSPVVIQATYPGTGEGGTTLSLNAKNYKQRPGLLLLNGTVYTAWSSHCDIGKYHGWILAYDAQSLKQVAVYNQSPNGNMGSFWAGGAAPAADASGNIYVVSGNGTFDIPSAGKSQDLGESYIKLSTAGGLSVADYFTPYNYTSLNSADLDTGSAGVVLIGDEAGSGSHPHLMAGAGKEGRIYLLDRDYLGKLNSGSDSQIVQSLPNAIGGLFGNPAYFNQVLYFCGSGDNLKAFSVVNAQMSSGPTSQSSVKFGFPGCVPTISANGTANAILWVIDPSGVLRAYDATNLASDLYDSSRNAARDSLGSAVKYSVPMVANGKVYAATQNSLVVYGLLTSSSTAIAVANAASGAVSALAPGTLVTIYGSGLSISTDTAAFPLPTALGGAVVNVGGLSAPILYASSTQLNIQIPFEASAGSVALKVTAGGAAAGNKTVSLSVVAPGLFLLPQGTAAAVNQDGSVNSQTRPAGVGSIISAYLTGLGPVNPSVATGAAAPSTPLSYVSAAVTATIGNVNAPVKFAGLAPGFTGLYQVNILVPQIASGQYPLQVAANGALSNSALIDVQD
jgi:uncharacterized protein (TIGR03437 family)